MDNIRSKLNKLTPVQKTLVIVLLLSIVFSCFIPYIQVDVTSKYIEYLHGESISYASINTATGYLRAYIDKVNYQYAGSIIALQIILLVLIYCFSIVKKKIIALIILLTILIVDLVMLQNVPNITSQNFIPSSSNLSSENISFFTDSIRYMVSMSFLNVLKKYIGIFIAVYAIIRSFDIVFLWLTCQEFRQK